MSVYTQSFISLLYSAYLVNGVASFRSTAALDDVIMLM